MLREPLVDERVVGREEIEDAPVFAHDAVEEQLHFAAHRLTQRIVEVRIDHRQRSGALQTAQVEPLAGEILGEGIGARIFQHALDLTFEDRSVF